jgi:hypothetical protein
MCKLKKIEGLYQKIQPVFLSCYWLIKLSCQATLSLIISQEVEHTTHLPVFFVHHEKDAQN